MHDTCRFQKLLEYTSTRELRLRVKTQFLLPHATYIVNLVYNCGHPHQGNLRIPFKYKADAMRQLSTSCVAYLGKDGWLRTELFQFTSTKKKHNFDIHFLSETKFGVHHSFSIEGIEFCSVKFFYRKLFLISSNVKIWKLTGVSYAYLNIFCIGNGLVF